MKNRNIIDIVRSAMEINSKELFEDSRFGKVESKIKACLYNEAIKTKIDEKFPKVYLEFPAKSLDKILDRCIVSDHLQSNFIDLIIDGVIIEVKMGYMLRDGSRYCKGHIHKDVDKILSIRGRGYVLYFASLDLENHYCKNYYKDNTQEMNEKRYKKNTEELINYFDSMKIKHVKLIEEDKINNLHYFIYEVNNESL